MKKDLLKLTIIKAVEDAGLIKGVELAVEITEQAAMMDFTTEDILKTLSELVDEGEIGEIQYVLPTTDKVKTCYAPLGTKIIGLK